MNPRQHVIQLDSVDAAGGQAALVDRYVSLRSSPRATLRAAERLRALSISSLTILALA